MSKARGGEVQSNNGRFNYHVSDLTAKVFKMRY
jgi:hypothetical protein